MFRGVRINGSNAGYTMFRGVRINGSNAGYTMVRGVLINGSNAGYTMFRGVRISGSNAGYTMFRGVRISGSNAGYIMFRNSVKGTGYPSPPRASPCAVTFHLTSTIVCTGQWKCGGTRAETRFRPSAKRTSPFKSAGASV